MVHRNADNSAGAVVFGIVMVAASYVVKPMFDVTISNISLSVWCLVSGLIMLLVPAAFKLMSTGFHWRSVAIYLSLVGSIEVLNLLNLAEPLEFKLMMQRYVCYAIGAAGIVYGHESMDEFSTFPAIFHIVIVGLTCLVGALWLKAAGTAAGMRFVGDSDVLTAVGVGYTFGILGCVSTAFLFTEQRLLFRLMHLVAYCICFLAILSTGSRGSAVFSLFIVGAGVVVRLRSFADGLRYSLLFMAVILVLVVVVFTNDYARNQLDFMLERFAFVSRGAVDISIVERQERRLFYYRSMDSWIVKGMQGYDYDYPHNIFFESVLRFGLVGCGLIFAIIYSSLRAGVNLRTSLSSPFVWVISSAGFFTLLVVQVNLMLEHARCLWLFVGFWGVKEVQRLHFGRMETEETESYSGNDHSRLIPPLGDAGSLTAD